MEARRLGRLPGAFPPVGLAVGQMRAEASAPEIAERTVPALLALAAERGVRLYDAGRGVGVEAAERVLGTTLPRSPLIRTTQLHRPERASGPGWIDAALTGVARRLGSVPALVFVGLETLEGPRLPEALEDAVTSGQCGEWGVRLGDAGLSPEGVAKARNAGARILRFPLSLLHPQPALDLLDACRSADISVLIEDPFSGGLLEGAATMRSGGRLGVPPVPIGALKRQWAPVLALGHLTAGRRRTLPQAAIQFALAAPAVVGVLVAPTDRARLEEYLDAPDRPPLGEDELRRVREFALGPAG